MDAESRASNARRVVSGLDLDGRSTIVHDDEPAARIERPGGATVTEIWRVDSLPASLADSAPLAADRVLAPAASGLAVRVCTFPPESAVDADAQRAYAAELERTYEGQHDRQREPNGVPGMHRTDTVDVVTVVSGELHVITETGETLLRQGDSIVQRGTAHAWSNRGSTTTTVVAIMMAASVAPPGVGDDATAAP